MICKTIDELREEIRRKLKETDQSARALAASSGVSSTHLNNFKLEKRSLTFENLDRLAGVLGVKYNLKNY